MENLSDLFWQIIDKPLPSLIVVVNLIVIESLLSVDNAAVLATMVLDLPKDQRRKALKYGLIGAYVFRGLCLLFAFVLIQIWWFKPLGGLYLLILALRYFFRKRKTETEAETIEQELAHADKGWLYKKTLGALGPFWSTVLMVEIMDLAFSIDNVIAANAYTHNIILIWLGVFIGILAMRFVAQSFVALLEKYPFLEVCAYIVIGMLGLKLSMSLWGHFYPCSDLALFMEGPNECLLSQGKPLPEGEHAMVWGDVLTSILSITIFLLPVLTSMLFNFPRHHNSLKKPNH